MGSSCKAILYELDELSNPDFISEARPHGFTRKFTLKVKDDFDDWPTPTLELYIEFQDCCGYELSRKIGAYLKNGTFVSYTLRDDNMYADIYV
uniref:Uncharacterized protein n=1 Tax=Panagrolaimus sp. ES5 TaxID=591445 RepID=A0AC34FRI4_9BILA